MKPNLSALVCVTAMILLPAASTVFGANAGTFVVSFLPGEISYNPLTSYTTSEAQIYSGLYEGLVGYDPFSLDPIPATASRWEISQDGRRYRFFIRPEARYSNGDPVVAADFREAWLLLLDPDTNAAYASLLDVIAGARAYRTGESTDPQSVGVIAVSERVLEVRLEQRATHFLRILCHHSFVAVHPSVRGSGEWGDPLSIPMNGPYTVASAGEDALGLKANPYYWDQRRERYDEISITFEADAQAVTRAFNNGEIDWVRGASDLQSVARTDDIVINPLYATTYYQLSATRPPFDDPRVRRAVALLLPWDRIRSEELWYVPTANLVPQIPAYPQPDGITVRDTKEALRLLDDAGYPNGEGLPPIEITIPTPLRADRVAQLMVESWEAALDTAVSVKVVPYPQYFTVVDAGDFMVSTISWIGDFADPLTFLDLWVSGSNLNKSGYSNADYDALIRRAMGMTGSARYEVLAEAEEMLLADGVVLPIRHSPSINLIDLNMVDGWYPNPLDIHPFKFIRPADASPVPNVAVRPGRQL